MLENGDEFTTDFAFKGDWIADNYNRLNQIPSQLNSYFRADKILDFNQIKYTIPNVDISAVIHAGVRLWQK